MVFCFFFSKFSFNSNWLGGCSSPAEILVNLVIERWVERGKQAVVSRTCKADISCPAVKNNSDAFLSAIQGICLRLLAFCLLVLCPILVIGVHSDVRGALQMLLSFTVRTEKDICFCRESMQLKTSAASKRWAESVLILFWLGLPVSFSCELFSLHYFMWEGGRELSCSDETRQRCYCERYLKLL